MPAYLNPLPGGDVLLHLYVQPKAAKSRIVGLHDGCLKLAIAAPPIDGRANEEVVRFLARLLNIAGRDITLHSGAQSRRKKVRLAAAASGEVLRRLEKILEEV